MKNLDLLLRENVRQFLPYSSAREEFSGRDVVLLDANENALGSPGAKKLNRYPDPYQQRAREGVAKLFSEEGASISPDRVFLGSGSDELIDLLIRATIEPKQDEVWVLEPTYGMYEVSAALQDALIRKIPLSEQFDLPENLEEFSFGERAKLLFLCSPNNPTSNILSREGVLKLLAAFPGVVVIDEAYIDFAQSESFLSELNQFSNLVILRTFSKAWGLAAARIGVGVMSPELREVLDRIKPPYNINDLTAKALIDALKEKSFRSDSVRETLTERERLSEELREIQCVEVVYPSDANFLLVKVNNAAAAYSFLLENGVVVRDRSSVPGCKECLRLTVGTREENEKLLDFLKKVPSEGKEG